MEASSSWFLYPFEMSPSLFQHCVFIGVRCPGASCPSPALAIPGSFQWRAVFRDHCLSTVRADACGRVPASGPRSRQSPGYMCALVCVRGMACVTLSWQNPSCVLWLLAGSSAAPQDRSLLPFSPCLRIPSLGESGFHCSQGMWCLAQWNQLPSHFGCWGPCARRGGHVGKAYCLIFDLGVKISRVTCKGRVLPNWWDMGMGENVGWSERTKREPNVTVGRSMSPKTVMGVLSCGAGFACFWTWGILVC